VTSADPAEAELEEQLSRLTGATRVAPLLRLAQLRANRYVRMPTGSAGAGAVLESALANVRELDGLLPPEDPGRPQVDNALGWLLSIRYTGHGGSPADRDSAISLLAGSVETAKLAPVQQQAAFLILGQLSALRALHLDPNGPVDPMKQSMGWMTTGLSERSRADLDRAHDYLSRVVAAGPENEQVRQAAGAMLQMVTMMRDMFSGMGQGSLMSNFNHLIGVMSRMSGAAGAAPSGFPPGFAGGGSAGSPLWTPAVGVPTIVDSTAIPAQVPRGEPPVRAPVAPPAQRPAPRPTPPDGMDELRGDLLRQLADHAGTRTTDPLAVLVTAVLRPDLPPMAYDRADEAVATATAIHDSGGGPVAADGVLLAVTLWLRARADDGGGWAGDPGASAAADRLAGLDALLDAVSALPPDDPLAASALAAAFGAGSTEALAAALRSGGIDAAAHVRPTGGGDLCTLVVGQDGKVGVGGVAPHPGPATGGDWAGRARAVLAPVLTPDRRRVVLIAPDGLGALPWATAAGDDVVLWTVGSVDRLLRSADRPARDVDADAVFVANPAGDRDRATVETMVLRRMLYPRSTGLGRTVEQVDGAGTPDEVLAHLPGPAGPGASLLHLGCAVRTTDPAALGLAPGTGPAWLDLGRVTARGREHPPDPGPGGGLVVLPADAGADPAGLLAVADALLDAGMGGAVHWLRAVPPSVATLVLYRLHEYLVDDRMSPPDAVAAVRRWMRDPDRQPPRCVPAGDRVDDDLTDPSMWGALVFRG
jgi:hypothetical protein